MLFSSKTFLLVLIRAPWLVPVWFTVNNDIRNEEWLKTFKGKYPLPDTAEKLLWVRALVGKSVRKPRSCWSGILSSIIIMAETCLAGLHSKPRNIMMSLLKSLK